MKNVCYYILFLSVLVVACSESKKPQTSAVEKKIEPEVKEEFFSFKQHHIPILKEQLFFFLRENAISIDANVFIKYEDLQVGLTDFKYTLVVIDKGILNDITEFENEEGYEFEDFMFLEQENLIQGDSIVIIGSLNVIDTQEQGDKKQIPEATVRIEAEYQSSYIQPSSPYGGGYGEQERISDAHDYEQTFTVDLNRSYDFDKSEIFLKARISALTDQALAGFSKDELAYLRNEIFARHGHSFKTEKMQKYFNDQSWYKPCFGDATPFLNELEKTNAQFIRSVEQ